jgi:hypothetical protein
MSQEQNSYYSSQHGPYSPYLPPQGAFSTYPTQQPVGLGQFPSQPGIYPLILLVNVVLTFLF